MLGERELIDMTLTELLLIHEVRAAVAAAAPVGYRLVDLYDVWLSSPTLASLVTAGEYRTRVEVEGGAVPSAADARTGICALLVAERIDVVRAKGQGEATIDIRPHLYWLRLVGDTSATFELEMRLRLGGEGGIGRPDEVVAALGERLGLRLSARDVVRERIVLADDPDA